MLKIKKPDLIKSLSLKSVSGLNTQPIRQFLQKTVNLECFSFHECVIMNENSDFNEYGDFNIFHSISILRKRKKFHYLTTRCNYDASYTKILPILFRNNVLQDVSVKKIDFSLMNVNLLKEMKYITTSPASLLTLGMNDFQNLTNLGSIKLIGGNIHSYFYTRFSPNLTNLKTTNLKVLIFDNSCFPFLDNSLPLINECENLENIVFNRCQGLTSEFFKTLSLCKRLKVLSITNSFRYIEKNEYIFIAKIRTLEVLELYLFMKK